MQKQDKRARRRQARKRTKEKKVESVYEVVKETDNSGVWYAGGQ